MGGCHWLGSHLRPRGCLGASRLGLARSLRRSSALTIIGVIASYRVAAVWLGCWGVNCPKTRWWAVLLSLNLLLFLMALGYPAALALANQ